MDESKYTEFVNEFQHTYFKEVYEKLSNKFKLGRVRILLKEPRSTLSWHRDPEPRLHIPIITNPGCLMVIENIAKHEVELLDYASQKIKEIEGVEIIGNAKDKASVLSFIMKNIHPHDIGTIMDSHGVAIRAGNHCTQPVMDFYSIPATARASFAIYNDKNDVDKLISSVRKTMEVFG